MDEDIDTYIVSKLADPWKFLFVDFDIAMVRGLVPLLFILSGQHVLGALLGGGLGYWLHGNRQNKPKGYLKHICYWLLPPWASFLRRTPPSYCMEMLG